MFLDINILGDDIEFEEKIRISYVLSRGSSPRYQRGNKQVLVHFKNSLVHSLHQLSLLPNRSSSVTLSNDLSAKWPVTNFIFQNL